MANSISLFQQKIHAFEFTLAASEKNSLEPLKLAFANEQVRLAHPRDIYPLYSHLMKVTAAVAQSADEKLKGLWKDVLADLSQRMIYRVGLGRITFDTSAALNILLHPSDRPKIHAAPIDIKNDKNRREVLDYMMAADWEAFGTCFQRGFLNELLQSDAVRCIVARNQAQQIVGILWGFLKTETPETQQFHFWEVSRKAKLSGVGIARALLDCAKQQQRLYPHVKFVTLNVYNDNMHAKELYEHEEFHPLSTSEKSMDRTFMVRVLNGEKNIIITDKAKAAVRQFVMQNVPTHKLLWYELARRCELLCRWLWYR